MTNGTDNLSNGSVADDRFTGQLGYRGVARREMLAAVPDANDPDLAHGDWLDSAGPLADHPLLRGLLLELPPKGSMPDPAWLDRWFEAARAILELLYAYPATIGTGHR